MVTFSQRNGFEPLPPQMVPESITADVRNSLWNVIYGYIPSSVPSSVTHRLWVDFYKLPPSSRSSNEFARANESKHAPAWIHFQGDFLSCKWHRAYDFVEVLVTMFGKLAPLLNDILERETAAYRIIGGQVVQITSAEEIAEM
jgi:hypothetical protein